MGCKGGRRGGGEGCKGGRRGGGGGCKGVRRGGGVGCRGGEGCGGEAENKWLNAVEGHSVVPTHLHTRKVPVSKTYEHPVLVWACFLPEPC